MESFGPRKHSQVFQSYAGNHEFYGHAIQDVEKRMIESAKSTSNVTYLSCSDFVLNGYRFLGTTLWTDYELFGLDQKHHAMHMAKDALADYHFIRKQKQSGDFITPEDTILLHRQHVKWLETLLRKPFPGKTIVITHMAPSIQSITAQYISDPVSAGFASNLEALVKKANLWVHGHIHESMDYMVGGCRVLANPCGYRTKGARAENWDFNPNLVISI